MEIYGLILIIALGESIVAIGAGSGAAVELRAIELLSAAFGIVAVAALWSVYFDSAAAAGEARLRATAADERPRFARDAYSYLHLPMVAGIVLFALGVKKALEYGGEQPEAVPAVALCAGVALYLAANAAFRHRGPCPRRAAIWAALACLALVPVAANAAAVVGLVAVTGALTALIGWEARKPALDGAA